MKDAQTLSTTGFDGDVVFGAIVWKAGAMRARRDGALGGQERRQGVGVLSLDHA